MIPHFAVVLSRTHRSRAALLATLALVAATTMSCDREEIHSYNAPKDPPPVQREMPPAMGGMQQTPQASAPAPKVEWTVPPGWSTVPTTVQMRLATFDAGGAEVSVAAFPGDVGGDLANVNRWRGQMSLSPIAQTDLAAALRTETSGSTKVSFVQIAGEGQTAGQMMLGAIIVPGDGQTWFVKSTTTPEIAEKIKPSFESFCKSLRMVQGATQPSAPAAAQQTQQSADPSMQQPAGAPPVQAVRPSDAIAQRLSAWKHPETWKADGGSGVVASSFTFIDGANKAVATATPLLGDGGGPMPNINRWRGQLGLPPATDIKSAGITSYGGDSTVVDITNEAKTDRMISVIVPAGASTWFFKLRGNPATVESQRAAFEKFVKEVGIGQ